MTSHFEKYPSADQNGARLIKMAREEIGLRPRRVIQHLVPIQVRSQQEQADVSIVNKNHPTAVKNVRDNVNAKPTRRINAALNADILRRLRS